MVRGGPAVGPGTSDVSGVSRELWATNSRTNAVVRIDARSGRITARLCAPAAADRGRHRPPVALGRDRREVLRYDRSTRQLRDRTAMPGGVVR